MDKRKKPLDKQAARRQREDFHQAIARGELTLQDAVKRMRQVSRLTQAEFAAHRDVSVKVIKEIERGTANPTVHTLNQIGRVFGLEVAFVPILKTAVPAQASRQALAGGEAAFDAGDEKIRHVLASLQQLTLAIDGLAMESGLASHADLAAGQEEDRKKD